MFYTRQCSTCSTWAISNNPEEERLKRVCPTCGKSMILLHGVKKEDLNKSMGFRPEKNIILPSALAEEL